MINPCSINQFDFSFCMFNKRAYIPSLQLASMIRHRAFYLYDHLVTRIDIGKLNRQELDQVPTEIRSLLTRQEIEHVTTEVRILFNEALRRELLPEFRALITAEVDMFYYVRSLHAEVREYVGIHCSEKTLIKWRNGTTAQNNFKSIFPELFGENSRKQIRHRRAAHVRSANKD